MTLAPSLVEQRLALRGQLQAQRQDIAERLFAAKARGQFPRSITMRLLVRRPELAGLFLTLVAGKRLAAPVSALLLAARALGSGSER